MQVSMVQTLLQQVWLTISSTSSTVLPMVVLTIQSLHKYTCSRHLMQVTTVLSACRNEPIDLLADLNGTWYDPSNNAIASSAIVTSDIAGQFNYDYIAGNGVCPDDTANVVVNVLATCNYLEVADELFYGVSLFPNPSEGTVFIASDATQSFDYVVTDENGRLIKEVSNGVKAAQTTEINLNNMETGVYFIKLSNDQAEKVLRVVIQ